MWGSDFLPAAHQGTRIVPGGEPIPNMTIHDEPAALQEMELGHSPSSTGKHLASRASDPSLAARMKSFETAFGMQHEAPEVFDLSKETDATHKLYGLERGSTQGFAWQCLVARRLAERGVRFIELIDSGSDLNRNWDAHFDIQTHVKLARNVDQPIAGAAQGPEIPRNAGRHAGGLDHRVRTDALQCRKPTGKAGSTTTESSRPGLPEPA